MKFQNFYWAGFGPPVQDLVYFFYEVIEANPYLDKTRSFLDNYYESFSATVQQFNQDPNKLFSKDKLLEFWKKFAKVSMFKILLAKKSLIYEDYNNMLSQTAHAHEYQREENSKNSSIYTLLQHMCDNNIL